MTLTYIHLSFLFAGIIVGAIVVFVFNKSRVAQLQQELSHEKQLHEERLAAQNLSQEQVSHLFSSLSKQALESNTQHFMKLAETNFKLLHEQSKHQLDAKEKSVEALVKPIREALEKTEHQLREMDKQQRETHGSLSRHLESMAQTQQVLQKETRNLVQALRRPEVRGQWGEMTLKRLAELAGMVEHCDFYEQEHVRTEEGAIRPDMVVRMPDSREIVVDVKTPLDAYLTAIESTDDTVKQSAINQHAKNVREHVKSLASKSYWNQFKNAPDFVVMFIPGEQFLSAALDVDKSLMEDALAQKVILATPTSFVALLRAVAYGWRQNKLAENAEHIRQVGDELYGRLATFAEHLHKLGRSLGSGVEHFNKAISSFDSRVLPSARKFNEMGIEGKKAVEQIEPVEKVVKTPRLEEKDK